MDPARACATVPVVLFPSPLDSTNNPCHECVSFTRCSVLHPWAPSVYCGKENEERKTGDILPQLTDKWRDNVLHYTKTFKRTEISPPTSTESSIVLSR